MAKWLLLMLVLTFVQIIFTHGEDRCNEISSCDQCIKCGGTSWCRDQNSMSMNDRCSFGSSNDNWCKNIEETVETPYEPSKYNPSAMIWPVFMSMSIFVTKGQGTARTEENFTYTSAEKKNITLKVETSQNKNGFEANAVDHNCNDGKCTFTIEAKADTSFCSSNSDSVEFTYVHIKVDNITEEATVKYNVPCACGCSKPERSASLCSGHGNFSCGVCSCDDGWSGWNCNISECGERGDINNLCTDSNGVECSGNGHCGRCGGCVCDTNKEGSQYFEPNFCSDICTQMSEHESYYVVHCLANATVGICHSTQETSWITKYGYNKTIADQKDHENRRIWIPCNETFITEEKQKCYVEYLVKKTQDGKSDVMVVKSCDDNIAAGGGGSGAGGAGGGEGGVTAAVGGGGAGVGGSGASTSKVPLILGILAGIAAVAAVTGFFAWKHFHATPAMPFASPDYQNIDAEDCVGQNPLYKPPTSTFINPQFGKC